MINDDLDNKLIYYIKFYSLCIGLILYVMILIVSNARNDNIFISSWKTNNYYFTMIYDIINAQGQYILFEFYQVYDLIAGKISYLDVRLYNSEIRLKYDYKNYYICLMTFSFIIWIILCTLKLLIDIIYYFTIQLVLIGTKFKICKLSYNNKAIYGGLSCNECRLFELNQVYKYDCGHMYKFDHSESEYGGTRKSDFISYRKSDIANMELTNANNFELMTVYNERNSKDKIGRLSRISDYYVDENKLNLLQEGRFSKCSDRLRESAVFLLEDGNYGCKVKNNVNHINLDLTSEIYSRNNISNFLNDDADMYQDQNITDKELTNREISYEVLYK